jgi:hypothetical protein
MDRDKIDAFLNAKTEAVSAAWHGANSAALYDGDYCSRTMIVAAIVAFLESAIADGSIAVITDDK